MNGMSTGGYKRSRFFTLRQDQQKIKPKTKQNRNPYNKTKQKPPYNITKQNKEYNTQYKVKAITKGNEANYKPK